MRPALRRLRGAGARRRTGGRAEEIRRALRGRVRIARDEPLAGAETLVDGGWILPGPGRRALPRRPRPGRAGRRSTRPTPRPAPTATPARCCCATAVHRSTPRRCRPATTCRRSSARRATWPARSATSAASPSSSTTRRLLADAVAEQAAAGDGWVKLVGDWIDRGRRRPGPAVARRRAGRRDRRRPRRGRPGHRARVRHRRAARADRRRHRLHRARHRADRRPDRRDGRAAAPRWSRR